MAYLFGAPARAQTADPCLGSPLFDSGDISALTGTYNFTFTQAGVHEYFSRPFPGMPALRGKVVVVDPVPATVPVDEEGGAGGAAVGISNFKYNPGDIRVKAGETVMWINDETPPTDDSYAVNISTGSGWNDTDGWVPKLLRIPTGGTVTWYNNSNWWWGGSEDHYVTSRVDGDRILIYDDQGQRITDADGIPVGGDPLYDAFLCTRTWGNWWDCGGWNGGGNSFSYTFTRPGTYKYFCKQHAGRANEYGEVQVGMEHTVTADLLDARGNPLFSSGPLDHNRQPRWSWNGDGTIANRKNWSHKFDTPGTYDYHCMIHSWMKGKVYVDATPETLPSPNPHIYDIHATVPESHMGGNPSRYSQMEADIPARFGTLQIPVNIEWDKHGKGHAGKVYMVRDDGTIAGFDLTDVIPPNSTNQDYWWSSAKNGTMYWRDGSEDFNADQPPNGTSFQGKTTDTNLEVDTSGGWWSNTHDIGVTYLLEFTYDGQFMRARVNSPSFGTGWYVASGKFVKLSLSSHIYSYYSGGPGPGSINLHVGNAMISAGYQKTYEGKRYDNPNRQSDPENYYANVSSIDSNAQIQEYYDWYFTRAWEPPNSPWGASWWGTDTRMPQKVDGGDEFDFKLLTMNGQVFDPKDMVEQVTAFPQNTRNDLIDYVLYSRYNIVWDLWYVGGYMWWDVFYDLYQQERYLGGNYMQYKPGYVSYFVLPPAPQSAIAPMSIDFPVGQENVLADTGAVNVVGLYNPVTQACNDNVEFQSGVGTLSNVFRWRCGIKDYGVLLGYTSTDTAFSNTAGQDTRIFKWYDQDNEGNELHHWRFARNPYIWWDGDPPDLATSMGYGAGVGILYQARPRPLQGEGVGWWWVRDQGLFNGWETDWYDYVADVGITLPPTDSVNRVSNRNPNYYQIVPDQPTDYKWETVEVCISTGWWSWWWGGCTIQRYTYLSQVRMFAPYRRPMGAGESLSPRGFFRAPGEYDPGGNNGMWNNQYYDTYFAKFTEPDTTYTFIPGESVIKDNGWMDYHEGDDKWYLGSGEPTASKLLADEDVVSRRYDEEPLTAQNKRECYVPNVHIDSSTDNARLYDLGWGWGTPPAINYSCDAPYNWGMPDLGRIHTRDYQYRWALGDTGDQTFMKSLKSQNKLSPLSRDNDTTNPFFMFGYYSDTENDGGYKKVRTCTQNWWGSSCTFENVFVPNVYYKVDPESPDKLTFTSAGGWGWGGDDSFAYQQVGQWYDYFPTYLESRKSYSTVTPDCGPWWGDVSGCMYQYLGGPSLFPQVAGYLFGNNLRLPNSKWLQLGPVDNGKNGWYDYDLIANPDPGPKYTLPTNSDRASVASVVYDFWRNWGNPPAIGEPDFFKWGPGWPGPKAKIWTAAALPAGKFDHVPGGAADPQSSIFQTVQTYRLNKPPYAENPPNLWPPPWYPDQDHANDYYGPYWYNYLSGGGWWGSSTTDSMFDVWTNLVANYVYSSLGTNFWFYAEVNKDDGTVRYPWWNPYYRWEPGIPNLPADSRNKPTSSDGCPDNTVKCWHMDQDPLGGNYYQVNENDDNKAFPTLPIDTGNEQYITIPVDQETCPNGKTLKEANGVGRILPYYNGAAAYLVDANGKLTIKEPYPGRGAPRPDPLDIKSTNERCPGVDKDLSPGPTRYLAHFNNVQTNKVTTDSLPLPVVPQGALQLGNAFVPRPGVNVAEGIYRNATLLTMAQKFVQTYPGADTSNPNSPTFPYGHWDANTGTPDYFQIGLGWWWPTQLDHDENWFQGFLNTSSLALPYDYTKAPRVVWRNRDAFLYNHIGVPVVLQTINGQQQRGEAFLPNGFPGSLDLPDGYYLDNDRGGVNGVQPLAGPIAQYKADVALNKTQYGWMDIDTDFPDLPLAIGPQPPDTPEKKQARPVPTAIKKESVPGEALTSYYQRWIQVDEGSSSK